MTLPVSDFVLDRKVERLRPDEAISDYERGDALAEGTGGISSPLHEHQIALINLCPHIPGSVRQIGEHMCVCFPDTVLAALNPGGRDEDGIVSVVGVELLQVARAQCPGMVLEDFLGRACHFFSSTATGPAVVRAAISRSAPVTVFPLIRMTCSGMGRPCN
jgi:hypothetical protein